MSSHWTERKMYLNLASHATYDEIDKSVEEGDWDGFHSGFPCGSFSRVRWRDSPGGAHPVRSMAHIYGLPGNTPMQQKEADEGTLMAVRSAWLHKKQIETCKRRAIRDVRKPSRGREHGVSLGRPRNESGKETKSSSAEFNTCPFQSKLKKRWIALVQARQVGRKTGVFELVVKGLQVPGLGGTSASCRKTQHRGSGSLYPEELTQEIARKVVNTWKRVLNLEWLRWQIHWSSQVSELQAKWLKNEEKKRKREYDDAEPVATNPLSTEKRFDKVTSKAVEAKPKETEELPSSSAGPSKCQRKEEQNDFSIGGMRNPATAVARLHQVKKVGEQISAAWLDFVKDFPKALEAAIHYGSNEAKIDKTVMEAWRDRLESLLGVEPQDGVTLKEAVEFSSPLYAPLWDAWFQGPRTVLGAVGEGRCSLRCGHGDP